MTVYVTVTSATGFDEYWFHEEDMESLTDFLLENARES